MTAPPTINRLSGDDMTQLAAEASGAPMQFAAVAVLDGAPAPDELRALLAVRVDRVPRLRQRLVRVPYGRPIWVDDPAFDIGRHIEVSACPAPGDRPALLAAAARIVTRRLPLSRPPWRIGQVTGLAGGRTALVIVLHHVLADGLAGLAILAGLVDGSTPDVTRTAGEEGRPTAAELRADAIAEHRRAVRRLPALPGQLRAAADELLHGGTSAASRCSINRAPVGPRRVLAVAEAELAAVVAAAKAAGGTVNDVVLTAATGGLGQLLADRGERLHRFVVSMPVSARNPAQASELGNRVGVRPVAVPVGGPPGERLPRVAAVTRSRRTGTPGASAVLYGPFVRALAAVGGFGWFIGHQRLVNTFVTNVRGPDRVASLGGRPVTELIPVSATSGNVGVAFAVLSYAGRLVVTVVADPDLCPQAGRLAELVQAQLDALTGRRSTR